MSGKDYEIELTAGGKTVKTTSDGLERASRIVKAGLTADKEGPYLAELEAVARARASLRAEKREAMAAFKDASDGLDDREELALAHLDALRAPLPLFDGTERDCPACGDSYIESAWVKAGRCPGCGVKS